MDRQGHSIYKHLERASDKKTVGQTDRQRDRMLDRRMVEQKGRQLDKHTNIMQDPRLMDGQMDMSNKLMDRLQAGHRHMDRQHNETEGDRNRVTDTGCQTDDGQTEGEQN